MQREDALRRTEARSAAGLRGRILVGRTCDCWDQKSGPFLAAADPFVLLNWYIDRSSTSRVPSLRKVPRPGDLALLVKPCWQLAYLTRGSRPLWDPRPLTKVSSQVALHIFSLRPKVATPEILRLLTRRLPRLRQKKWRRRSCRCAPRVSLPLGICSLQHAKDLASRGLRRIQTGCIHPTPFHRPPSARCLPCTVHRFPHRRPALQRSPSDMLLLRSVHLSLSKRCKSTSLQRTCKRGGEQISKFWLASSFGLRPSKVPAAVRCSPQLHPGIAKACGGNGAHLLEKGPKLDLTAPTAPAASTAPAPAAAHDLTLGRHEGQTPLPPPLRRLASRSWSDRPSSENPPR